jgi:hypothetical protein
MLDHPHERPTTKIISANPTVFATTNSTLDAANNTKRHAMA